jgi:hypothetical protein
MQSAIKLNFSNTFSYFHLIDYTFAAPITLIDLVFSNTLEEIAVDLQFRRDNTTRRSIRCRWFRFYVWDAQIWEYSVAYQLNRFRCYCQLSCVTSAPLEISKQTSSAKEKGEDCPGERWGRNLLIKFPRFCVSKNQYLDQNLHLQEFSIREEESDNTREALCAPFRESVFDCVSIVKIVCVY